MSLSRSLLFGLAAIALGLPSKETAAQAVQIRGTFAGIPLPPQCPPPAGEDVQFQLVGTPALLEARLACDTGSGPPLRLTCLPLELGGSGTNVAASYSVVAGTSAASELFVECPTDASTVVTNLQLVVQDLFPDLATYLANPEANAPERACLTAVGGATVTRASYAPATRILSFDCQTGTTTTTTQCFTYTGVPVSSPLAGSGLGYQRAPNGNTLEIDDCIGFGAENSQAGNTPALITGIPFGDGFEDDAAQPTTLAIGALDPSPAVVGQSYSVPVTVSATNGTPAGVVLVSDGLGANCSITLSATGSGACSLAAATAGARTVRATFTGTPQFAPSTQTAAQTVGVGSQTITFNPPASITYAPGGTLALSATGGASGNPVVFASTTPSRCTVSGSTLTIVSATPTGQFCTVTANQAGNANYSAAPEVTRNITINRAPQTITFNPPDPPPRFDQTPFQISATGGGSGNPVVFTVLTPNVCSVASSTATTASINILQRNTCTITAQQAGNANYLQAPDVTRDIVIQFGNQSISFNPPASRPFVAQGTFAITATGGGSTSSVVFSSLSPNICTVTGTPSGSTTNGTVTMLNSGTCVLSALQAGDSNYNPAPSVTREVELVP